MSDDVVLSSGFLAFASHCGFLAALEQAPHSVEGVCGTSSGALTGALWAAGMPARQILAMLTEHTPLSWVRLHSAPWRGVFLLDRMINELSVHLPATFEGLDRPFGVGVADGARKAVLLTNGSLPQAVAASCAVPHLFAPVVVGGVSYQDGGVVDRLFLDAWRVARPASRPVVHLVERSSGAVGGTGLEGVAVVRSPRSGAHLWSLGDFADRFERTRCATLEMLEQR